MMRTMRENTKVIMLVTAVAFVGLMVFEWGMDLSGRSSAQASGGEIGRINGDPVSYEAFMRVYQGLYTQRQQQQQQSISISQDRQIEDAAWNQVVMDVLIAQEVDRRGLAASEEEIQQAARFAPPPELYTNELFQTDGQFDLTKYQQFLASPAVDDQFLLQLEAYYRQMIPRNKLYRQVVAGYFTTDGELWRLWRDQNEQVRVRYVAMDPDAMVPEGGVTVTDAEVEAFYEAHREDFARPAQAQLRVVWMDKTPTAADTAASLERAEAVRQEILDGADFAEVAQRESADAGSADRGGDLGTVSRGMLPAALEEAVWSVPLSRVSEPVQTALGLHLVRVRSRDAEQAEVSHILIPIERTDESEIALLERADSLEALGETMSVEAAAAELGLESVEATITPELPVVSGVGAIDDGSYWVFEDAEPGDVSPVFESDNAFYMLELVDRQPEGTLTLEEASPGIRTRMLMNERLERARQTGRELVDEVRASSLDAVAEARGLEIIEAGPFSRLDFVPGIGQRNAVIGAAFGLEEGEVSGLVEANGIFFIVESVERIPADSTEFEEQKAELRARMAAGIEQDRWLRYLGGLRENAKILDFRDQVLRPTEEQQQQQQPMMPGIF